MADTRQSRYKQVVAILDRAAGASRADYGGESTEPFWRQHSALLAATVGGVAMIAPEENGSSCCSGSSTRSARSGLIRGLDGEAPFDGTRFPPLPWGGSPVAEDDIAFIARWIDDGCHEEDYELGSTEASGDSADIEMERIDADNVEPCVIEGLDEGLDVYPGSLNEYAAKHGEIQYRMNIDCLDAHQLDRLRQAMRHLYFLNKWPADRRSYNNVALIHQNHCQHGWERFLPWHRVYMYEFEQALQDHFPDVTLPYWDWTMPQYCPSQPEKGWRIPKALQAFLTEESLAYLATADPPVPRKNIRILSKNLVEPTPVTFASQRSFFDRIGELIGKKYTVGAHRERFIDALLESNSLWYPLRYPGEYLTSDGEPGTITEVIQYHYPTANDIAQIVGLKTFRDFGGGSLYNDSFGFLDQNPHNTMHIWTGGMNPDYDSKADESSEKGDSADRNRTVKVTGRLFHTRKDMYSQPQYGDMFSNLTASYDPVFWPVHSNVDRLWWQWQHENPHALPIDLESVLTPWSYTIADTLDASRFGYDYVKCSFLVPVGLEAPVGRFVSKPIPVPAAAATGSGKIEVRLHRVPQLLRSGFVRVFLDLPGADASTPISHPNYAGYLAIFGHGACYGGPGHCDLPPRNPRPYDHRPRSHNTPRNHRIDVTECARRLLDEGTRELRITLVVIGADYREDSELLRLDGVSLSFLD
ncbi:MAG: tyrosinase family protein [Acidobacteriota bacterium]